MRIVVGIPSYDMVHADFCMSLARIMGFTCKVEPTWEVGIVSQKTSIIEKGRHEIIEQAKAIKADKVLFLDSDMVFPADTLKLMMNHKKDIVGINAITRNPPHKPTAKYVSGKVAGFKDVEKTFFGKEKKPELMTGIEKVGFLGTGCLLIDMKVFDKIKDPYFKVEFANGKFLGEDYDFCVKAREFGFDIWCDYDLSNNVGHLGMFEIKP